MRDECDIVGEDVEDIWWSGLDSKVPGVAIMQDGYLSSAFDDSVKLTSTKPPLRRSTSKALHSEAWSIIPKASFRNILTRSGRPCRPSHRHWYSRNCTAIGASQSAFLQDARVQEKPASVQPSVVPNSLKAGGRRSHRLWWQSNRT